MCRPSCNRFLATLVASLALCGPALAETTAQSVHWGAIAYPDKDRTLTAGFVTDRFTEFDGTGNRYNNIRETMSLNFWTLSWTERLARSKGWNANLTVGAGPTRDGFSRFLQNDVVHKFRGLTPVPVGAKREETDFMFSGTLTRWTGPFGEREDGFAGAAFHEVAPQNYFAQASVGFGNYRADRADATPWEIELAFTVDSGLFVDHRGDALEERFVSVALRYAAASFETWNDLINQKDYGPTFGARPTLDLLYLYDRW